MICGPTDWERRVANRLERPRQPVDPRMIELREQGYTNHQIALITGRRLSEVNLSIGYHNLKGY